MIVSSLEVKVLGLNWSFPSMHQRCFFVYLPNKKTFFTLFNACKGAAIEEKLTMNFLQYWDDPKKNLTSVTVLGLGQFKMTSTLEGSIFNSPP